MKRNTNRKERVANTLQRELALIIQREIKDPRLPQFITVSEVVITKDLEHATVYITILDDDVEKGKLAADILNKATGFLRTALAKQIKLRISPQLKFIYDTSVEHGNRLRKIIESVAPETPDDEDKNV